MKAIWNNQVIAESDETIFVEAFYYFPPDSVNYEFLQESDTHTTCNWKGEHMDVRIRERLRDEAYKFKNVVCPPSIYL